LEKKPVVHTFFERSASAFTCFPSSPAGNQIICCFTTITSNNLNTEQLQTEFCLFPATTFNSFDSVAFKQETKDVAGTKDRERDREGDSQYMADTENTLPQKNLPLCYSLRLS